MAGQRVVSASRRRQLDRSQVGRPTEEQIEEQIEGLRPHKRHGKAGRIAVRCGECHAVLTTVDLGSVLNRTLDRPAGLPRVAPDPGIGATGWAWNCSCSAKPNSNATKLWDQYRAALEAGTDIYVGGGRRR